LTPLCTKSFVGCGFAPAPTGAWSLQCSPDPIAVFRGVLLKGGKGERREVRDEWEKIGGRG